MQKNPNIIRSRKTFSKKDDEALVAAVLSCETRDWKIISKMLGKWTPRQCKERWKNYVDPSLLKTNWTPEEDNILLQKYAQFGSEWKKISEFLPGRAINAIKNRHHYIQQMKKYNVLRQQSTQQIKDTKQIDEIEMYLKILSIENLMNHH